MAPRGVEYDEIKGRIGERNSQAVCGLKDSREKPFPSSRAFSMKTGAGSIDDFANAGHLCKNRLTAPFHSQHPTHLRPEAVVPIDRH
jgi:hypothetical protein